LIALALIFARFFGLLFSKIKQPAVIGEILAGVILGGLGVFLFFGQEISFFGFAFTVPDLNYHATNTDIFDFLAEIGILFLLFISGLETNLAKLKKMEKISAYVAVGGVIMPFFFGLIAGILLGYSIEISTIIGLILTATSIGVTVRSLMDIGALDTNSGTIILGSAVIDDVIAILLFAIYFALSLGNPSAAIWVGIKIVIFFLVFLFIALRFIDKILDLGEKVHLPKAFLSISLAILLIYSFFADKAGISGVVGAFIAGLLIGQNVRSVKIMGDVKALGFGLFIPIFFVWVGSSLWVNSSGDINAYLPIFIISLVFIIAGIFGKILGCGIGAKLAGMTYYQSLQIGVGMIPRMELALIIVSVSISRRFLTGEIAHEILVATILLTIITTLIAPFLIKATFKND
jgi:Kef-type K+ transport system membrane component KefB